MLNNETNKHELALIRQEKKQIEKQLKKMSSQDSGYLDLKRTHKELGVKEAVVLEKKTQESLTRASHFDSEPNFMMMSIMVGATGVIVLVLMLMVLSKGM